MKYDIVYDKQNRLRLKMGHSAFTQKQGFSITQLLETLDGVLEVETNHINGGILIYYKGACRECILDFVSQMDINDLSNVPVPKGVKLSSDSILIDGIASYVVQSILPPPLKAIMAINNLS